MSVAALAGRRVDAADAPSARFPPENVALVRRRIREELTRLKVQALVCSAACGADLLALAVAGDLGIRRCAVLPEEPARFRHTSVIDRPGDWGPLFDRVIADVLAHGDLVTLDSGEDLSQRYLVTNTRILDDAQQLAQQLRDVPVALVIWDGQPRGEHDVTDAFGSEARQRRLRVVEISTLR